MLKTALSGSWPAGADLSGPAKTSSPEDESDQQRSATKDQLTSAVIAIIVAVFSWWIIPVNILYVSDSLYYVSSAASLAAGEGYRTPILAGNPSTGMYPPLQSVYLSIAWRLNPSFPENQHLIKMLMVVLWTATTAILFTTMRRGGLGRFYSALVALTVGTSGGWIYFVAHAFSDVLFSFLALALVSLWIKSVGSTRLMATLAASGVLLALMYLTRIATFGFLPGVFLAAVCCSWHLKTWKPIVLIAGPVVSAMIFWSLMPKETFGYGPYATGEIERHGGVVPWLWHAARLCAVQSIDYLNANHLLQGLSTDVPGLLISMFPGNAFWAAIVKWVLALLGCAFLAITFLGAWRSRGHRVLQIAVATYALQVLVWPFPLGLRGLLPLLALAILWACRGVQSLPSRWHRPFALAGLSYLFLCLCSNMAGSNQTNQLLNQTRLFEESRVTGEWIREHIPPTATLASELMLPILHIYSASQHPVIDMPHDLSRAFGFDYVLVLGSFPLGKPIGDKNAIHFVVAWESPQQTFQVLRKMNGKTLATNQITGDQPAPSK